MTTADASAPTLAEVVELLHGWFPPETAEEWDAVGLVLGVPEAPVRRILFAVDPVLPVADEAAAWGADLLVVHHPLFLRGVHGVPATTPKGRTLHRLSTAGCALLAAHTNADRAADGVSTALADTLGLADSEPIVPGEDGRGMGRVGGVPETSLADFAASVVAALPATAQGVRVAGDPDRPVRRVAVVGGAGDFLLDEIAHADADVYVTSDLRHHPALEFLEKDGPALVDVSHWAAEWTWLPVIRTAVQEALGDTVETRVSTLVTDPWEFRL
jgi:dinuclear metal center YbgI/SA1388 family protein